MGTDPTTLRVRTGDTAPAFDLIEAGGVQPESVEAWLDGLPDDPMARVRAVGVALYNQDGVDTLFTYQGYGSLQNARPTIDEGLAAGGGECDWFAAVGYHALKDSFAKGDLVIAQSYGNGSWHNVIIFRNPESGRFDVLNYEDIHTLDAQTPAEALRRFFGSPETGVIYRVPETDGHAKIDYFVRSTHQASLTGALSNPGLEAAMRPSFGHTRGGVTPAKSTPALYVEPATRRAGFSAGPHKLQLSADLPTQGFDALYAAEHWKLSERGYFGVVGAVELRYDVRAQPMANDSISLLQPALAVSGERRAPLGGGVETYVNGHAQLVVPLVLSAADREAVANSANGVALAGLFDPGALGASEASVNAGVRYETPRLYAEAQVTAMAHDPTLSGSPFSLAAYGQATLSLPGPWAVGVEGGSGLYDRDVRLGVTAASHNVELGAGMFRDGSSFAYAGATYRYRDLTLSGRAELTAYGSDVSFSPSVLLTLRP